MVERIRELCREKGISILKLEMACGFSNGSVNKWSRQSPSADMLLTVASYFGVSMESLPLRQKTKPEIPKDFGLFPYLTGSFGILSF